MIHVDGLSKFYGSFQALKSVDCKVQRGMMNGLVGPNGSGKTTLIHCVLNQLEFEGNIHWSQDPATIFFIPDENILPDLLLGSEYLGFIESLYKVKNDQLKETLLIAFDMVMDIDKPIHSYSYGMKKKVQIIAGLIVRPDILILDEIFRGLDMMAIATTKKQLLEYTRTGKTVLLSSHDILAIEQLCQNIIFLLKGNLKASGTPEALMQKYDKKTLEDVFIEMLSCN